MRIDCQHQNDYNTRTQMSAISDAEKKQSPRKIRVGRGALFVLLIWVA